MSNDYSGKRLLRGAGRLLVAVGLLLVLARCDWTTEPVEKQSLVVEVFLETDRPLPPVTLRETRPLSAPPDRLGESATGATVALVLGDSAIAYAERAPGRYRSKTPLLVPPRTPWRLRVKWNGTTARAAGVTPPPIEMQEVRVDAPDEPVRAVQVDSLRRDSLDIPADQGYLYPIEVTVQWEHVSPPAADSVAYWVRAQLRPDASSFPSEVVDLFLEPAQIQREDQFPQRADTMQWKGVYAVPVDSSDAALPPHDLTTVLVRGDSAFAAFAQTRTDPDRREPISNVEGALGVALAVSVDSLSLSVTDSTIKQNKPQGWTSRR